MSLTSYIKETRAEMRHVAWPTQRQTAIYTIIVVIISILVALYVGMFDFGFTKALEKIVTGGSAPAQSVTTSGNDSPLEVTQEPIQDSAPTFDITPQATPAQ